MGKTTLTNKAGFNVQVKEGNSNIFRILQVLRPGNSMIIQVDSSATYREYVLIVLPNNKKLRALSSDDIQEFHAIEIFKDEVTGEVDWKPLQGGAERRSLLGSIFGWFSSRSGAKTDAKTDPKAAANVEPNADSSKSSTATQ